MIGCCHGGEDVFAETTASQILLDEMLMLPCGDLIVVMLFCVLCSQLIDDEASKLSIR